MVAYPVGSVMGGLQVEAVRLSEGQTSAAEHRASVKQLRPNSDQHCQRGAEEQDRQASEIAALASVDEPWTHSGLPLVRVGQATHQEVHPANRCEHLTD